MARKAELIKNKVDESLFEMPFLHKKDVKTYYNKFRIDEGCISPFF